VRRAASLFIALVNGESSQCAVLRSVCYVQRWRYGTGRARDRVTVVGKFGRVFLSLSLSLSLSPPLSSRSNNCASADLTPFFPPSSVSPRARRQSDRLSDVKEEVSRVSCAGRTCRGSSPTDNRSRPRLSARRRSGAAIPTASEHFPLHHLRRPVIDCVEASARRIG